MRLTKATLAALAAMLVLGACNTALGVGRDAVGGARMIGRAVTSDDG